MAGSAPAGIAFVPPPWTVHCETYWFPLWLPRQLPKGAYDPLEASFAGFADSGTAGEFKGGLGMIQIVRYTDSPVGPYDELLVIPGNFSVPGRQTSHLRITRIYVSQRDTTYNGRVHWNIPKHIARFTFSSPPTTSSSPPASLYVAVYPPDPSATVPFFSATLTPFRFPPAIPLSSKYIPLPGIAQPPLPAADPESKDAELLAGTDRWKEFPAVFSAPKARGCWVEVHAPKPGSEEEKEAERWWPVSAMPFRVGFWLEQATGTIGAPNEWEP